MSIEYLQQLAWLAWVTLGYYWFFVDRRRAD